MKDEGRRIGNSLRRMKDEGRRMKTTPKEDAKSSIYNTVQYIHTPAQTQIFILRTYISEYSLSAKSKAKAEFTTKKKKLAMGTLIHGSIVEEI